MKIYQCKHIIKITAAWFLIMALILPLMPTLAVSAEDGAEGPALHWAFEDKSGTTASDSSGNGYDGTLYIAPSFSDISTERKTINGTSNALDFGSREVQYNISTENAVVTGYPFTMSCWVKTSNDANSIGLTALSMGNSALSNQYVRIRVGDGGFAIVDICPGDNLQIKSSKIVADGEWHLLTAVFRSENDMELYIDAVSEKTNGSSRNCPTGLNRTSAGVLYRHGTTKGDYFDGCLDDARVYTRALSVDEIMDLYDLYIDVTGVTLNKGAIELEIGETENLEATVLPEGATNANVEWDSSDKKVATVEDGLVTALAAGETTITVTTEEGEFPAECVVTVLPYKTELQNLVADAKKIGNDNYTDASWNAMKKALADAETVLTKGNAAKQAEYDNASAALKAAMVGLTKDTVNVPTNLKAESAGTTSIKLSWTGVNNVDGYEVWYADSLNGTYKKLASVTGNSYTHSGLSMGETYYYKVCAYKKVNNVTYNSAYTSVASLTLSINSPTNVKTESNGATSIKVSWKKAGGVSGYEIYRSTAKNGTYKKTATVGSSNSSYTDKNLTAGRTYYYKIRAYRTISGSTKYSNYTNAVKRKAALAKPANIKAVRVNKTSIKVSWKKVTGATGYEIYRAASKNGRYTKVATVSRNKTSYTNSKLAGKKTYFYKVKAIQKEKNKTYRSSFSDVKSAKTK